MKSMTVDLPETIFQEIVDAAKARGVSTSEIICERLGAANDSSSDSKESLWSRMEHLVIREAEGPTDLSTNPRHLEGYGEDRHR